MIHMHDFTLHLPCIRSPQSGLPQAPGDSRGCGIVFLSFSLWEETASQREPEPGGEGDSLLPAVAQTNHILVLCHLHVAPAVGASAHATGPWSGTQLGMSQSRPVVVTSPGVLGVSRGDGRHGWPHAYGSESAWPQAVTPAHVTGPSGADIGTEHRGSLVHWSGHQDAQGPEWPMAV
jgi:hypothetical protein